VAYRQLSVFRGWGERRGDSSRKKGVGELSREIAYAVLSTRSAGAVVSVAAAFSPVQWIMYYSLIQNLDG